MGEGKGTFAVYIHGKLIKISVISTITVCKNYVIL
jgi:uncharacterized protein (AIM24 family)